MKHHYHLAIAVVAILAHSCKPIVMVTVPASQPGLPDSAECVLLGKSDTTRIMEKPIGELSYELQSRGYYWTYAEQQDLQLTALRVGANVIKVEDFTRPGRRYPVRVVTKLYRVGDPKHYEKVIEWSEDRKLQLADFRGAPDPKKQAEARTVCEFEFRPGSISLGNSVAGSQFYCQLSWIDGAAKDAMALLVHEQGNFDLCELYRRELEQSLRHCTAGVFAHRKAELDVIREVYRCYVAKLAQYEADTRRGLDEMRQADWTSRIARQLGRRDEVIDPFFELDHVITKRQRDSVARSLQPPPDKALVYVFRPKKFSTSLGKRIVYNPLLLILGGWAYFVNIGQYTVDIDDVTLGPLHGRDYLYQFLDPGTAGVYPEVNKGVEGGIFRSASDKQGKPVHLSLKGGNTYYFQMITPSGWGGRTTPVLELLSDSDGKGLFRSCTLINDVIDLRLHARPFYE